MCYYAGRLLFFRVSGRIMNHVPLAAGGCGPHDIDSKVGLFLSPVGIMWDTLVDSESNRTGPPTTSFRLHPAHVID